MIEIMYVFWHRDKEKRLVIEEIGIYNKNFKSVIYKFDYSNNYLDEVDRMQQIYNEIKNKIKTERNISIKEFIKENRTLFLNTNKYENKDKLELIKNQFIEKKELDEQSNIIDYFTYLKNIQYSITALLMFDNLHTLVVTLPFLFVYEITETDLKRKFSRKYGKYKQKNQIRKLILKLHLITNMVLFTCAGYKNLNPFMLQDISKLSEDEIEENIHSAIDKNKRIDENDKKILKEITMYALDDKYIDYKELYKDLKNVRIYNIEDIKYDDEGYTICAEYVDDFNFINVYNSGIQRRTSILHEIIHSSGSFESMFLNEGMTSLIEREYYEELDDVDAYGPNVNVIRILCELVGSDIVLKSYNEKNDNILYEALSEICGTKEDAKKFIKNLDNSSIYLNYSEKKSIFEFLYVYLDKAHEKNIIDDDELDVCKRYLKNIIQGVIVDPDYVEYYFNVDNNKEYKLKK